MRWLLYPNLSFYHQYQRIFVVLPSMNALLADVLRKHLSHFSPVVSFNWHNENILLLDLTEANQELLQLDLQDTRVFTDYVFGKMQQVGARVAVGGYNEDRYIYRRSAHFNNGEEARSVHLGIDVWGVAGTPIYAPIDGILHSFQHNDRFGDYGPTVILEHRLDGIPFYTLYGHLSLRSLDGLKEGAEVRKGDWLAEIGNFPENGHWPPHLHFQIIADMQGHRGDFPGVCRPSERETYLARCPDANLILGIPQLNS
jgi:peptidoglycan LD-endopeptidase LytH